jgi:hypothetical protein
MDDRPDCSPDAMISAESQQEFLTRYTIDFLTKLYADPDQSLAAGERLGILPSDQAPERLYDLKAKINFLPASSARLPILIPEDENVLSQNQVGGDVQINDLTAVFCPEGYYVPDNAPGTEPCKRVNFNQPGYPQQLLLDWEVPGAGLRALLPESAADLTQFAALQLRVALDPLSELNLDGQPQSFTVELVDTGGRREQVILPDIEYPPGLRQPNEFFEGDFFTGHVFMRTLRTPLDEFTSVDLSQIVEIALLFDRSETGAIFIADLELVKE